MIEAESYTRLKDIVAIDDIDKKMLICEVKLKEKRLNMNELVLKSKNLIQKYKNY